MQKSAVAKKLLKAFAHRKNHDDSVVPAANVPSTARELHWSVIWAGTVLLIGVTGLKPDEKVIVRLYHRRPRDEWNWLENGQCLLC